MDSDYVRDLKFVKKYTKDLKSKSRMVHRRNAGTEGTTEYKEKYLNAFEWPPLHFQQCRIQVGKKVGIVFSVTMITITGLMV